MWHMKKVLDLIIRQGNTRKLQMFFAKMWAKAFGYYTEDNATTLAAYILENLLAVMPTRHVNKAALLQVIEDRYKEGGFVYDYKQ